MYLYIINFKNDIDMKDFIRETGNVTYGTFSHLNGMGVYQIRCKSENKAYIRNQLMVISGNMFL